MTEASIKQSRTAEYRAKLDELINSGVVQDYNIVPPRQRATPSQNRCKGCGIQWICEHVDFDEKKCLFWPLAKNNGHPGSVGYCGLMFKPAKLMCWLAHGAPPSAHDAQ